MNNSKNCSEHLSKVFRTGISMSQKFIILSGSFLFALSSCGPSKEEMEYREKSEAIADSIATYADGISTDTINGITHNFAKTADIRFKVQNVIEASDRIEDLVKERGGYISLSNLSSQINYSTTVKFKEDSIAEIAHYTTSNAMSLRVPNKQLDSVTRLISKLAVFIDSRKLKADDMKLSLYANSLAEKRYHTYEIKLEKTIQKNSGDLKQEIKGREQILEKQTFADNTAIDSYSVADKVNYATLFLEFYQTEQIITQKSAIKPLPETFIPSFWSQAKTAFYNGFDLLKNILLFMAKSWSLVFLFFMLYLLYKKIKPWIDQKTAPGLK